MPTQNVGPERGLVQRAQVPVPRAPGPFAKVVASEAVLLEQLQQLGAARPSAPQQIRVKFSVDPGAWCMI